MDGSENDCTTKMMPLNSPDGSCPAVQRAARFSAPLLISLALNGPTKPRPIERRLRETKTLTVNLKTYEVMIMLRV